MTEFNCTGCGLCCNKVGKTVLFAKTLVEKGNESEYINEVANFPHGFDDSGKCDRLIDNKCSIYLDRPLICNVRRVWERFHSESVSFEEYCKLSEKACDTIKKEV